MVAAKTSPHGSVEGRLRELGISLPAPPTPLGSYVETTQEGKLLFLSGMLPIVDHKPAYVGRLGGELDAEAGRGASRIAVLNALAAARQHLGSLDRIRRVLRLGVFMATAGEFAASPGVADGASDLLRDLFGSDNMPARSVIGVASLPLNVPVELEITFAVAE
jgi:enamine deaminase RidA (YjgF/YER057c/UK114 family)